MRSGCGTAEIGCQITCHGIAGRTGETNHGTTTQNMQFLSPVGRRLQAHGVLQIGFPTYFPVVTWNREKGDITSPLRIKKGKPRA